MNDETDVSRSSVLALTSEIVAAQVANNATTKDELPALIQTVFDRLSTLAADEPVPAERIPAVPVKRSITDDYLICLEDGRKLKMFKRHLMTAYGLSPEEYRVRWGLRADYPMVAPAYARKRQDLAIKIGLGRKPEVSAPAPKPAKAAPAKPKRSKAKATAA